MEVIEILNRRFEKILWDSQFEVCMIAPHYDDLLVAIADSIRNGGQGKIDS